MPQFRKSRSMSKNITIAMMPFDGKYLNLQMLCFSTFALALTVFEILTFEIFDLERQDQGQRVQHSLWWCYSMANVEIYKCYLLQFCVSSHRFRDIDIWNIWPWKSRSRSKSITFAMMPLVNKYWNPQISSPAVLRQLSPFSRYWHLKYMTLK